VVVYLHAFVTSALNEGEWSASPPGKEPLVSMLKEVMFIELTVG
jgi:hypothetical protein